MFSPIRIIFKNNFRISCFRKKSRSRPIGILGAPFNKGQPKEGVEKAPDSLRELGLIKDLQSLGVDVKDYGNIKFDNVEDTSTNSSGILYFPLTVGAACKKVSDAVKKVLLENRICVTIGGDHSLGLGTVHGHSEVNDICVLWIDAHVDINTPFTTLSGFMHGLPCSFFIEELKKFHRDLPGFEWVKPRVKKSNIAYIGLRDIDPMEKLILMKENILHFTMRDIDKLGIYEVIRRALETINPIGEFDLHVSFDIDSICKLQAPSTGTPVIGGLTVREALCIAEEISTLDSFKALDIMEINPTLGTKIQIENTLEVGLMLIKAFFGHSRHGSLPNNVEDIPIA